MSGYVWRGRQAAVNPCACGCGEEAPIAKRTDSRYGQVKGQPKRYISGHNPPGKSPVPSAADLGHTGPRPRRKPSAGGAAS